MFFLSTNISWSDHIFIATRCCLALSPRWTLSARNAMNLEQKIHHLIKASLGGELIAENEGAKKKQL